MTEIFVDPTKQSISVRVESQSLHIVGFEINVYAADGNTVLETFTGDTKTNPFIKSLSKKPSDYAGGYISGTFKVIEPNGKDFTYTLEFSIVIEDAIIHPDNTLSGITRNGIAKVVSTFHLN